VLREGILPLAQARALGEEMRHLRNGKLILSMAISSTIIISHLCLSSLLLELAMSFIISNSNRRSLNHNLSSSSSSKGCIRTAQLADMEDTVLRLCTLQY
jgi:hypothetical protein